MHVFEQLDVASPGNFCLVFGSSKPVAADEGKRAFFLTEESPPDDILPVSAVYDNFPDVMTFRRWAPCGLLSR